MSEIIYILLPVHNRKQTTSRFIECLLQQTCKQFHLVLIDDGSTDGTAEFVKEQIDNVEVLKGDGNLWWAGSLNLGISWLKKNNLDDNDIVLIINDDVLIKPDFLEKGKRIISNMPDSLLLAQHYDPKTGNIHESGVFADLNRMQFRKAENSDEINCLSTRGLFIRWQVMEEVGKFRQKYLPHYISDYEYTIRASKKLFKLVTVPDVHLIIDRSNTGLRNIDTSSFQECYRQLFDIRYVMNPVYWTYFAVFVSPWRLIIPNIIRIWYRAAKILVYSIK